MFISHKKREALPKIYTKYAIQKFSNLCVDPSSLYVISGHISSKIEASPPIKRTFFHVGRNNFPDGVDWVGYSLIPSCTPENEADGSSKHNEDEVIHTDIFSQRRDVMFGNCGDETCKQCLRNRCDFNDSVTGGLSCRHIFFV